jgi:Ca2+-transporting ATPase
MKRHHGTNNKIFLLERWHYITKCWFANGFGHLGIQYWFNIPHWQTIAFTVLCFSQMGHVMAIVLDENLF